MSRPLETDGHPLPFVDEGQLDFLDGLSVPIWIYDFEAYAIRWANREALAFWAANSLDELRCRPFHPDTEGVRARIGNLRFALEKGDQVTEHWTLYPAGQPSPVFCTCRGIRLRDGGMAMLVEAHLAMQDPTLATELRTVEAIRHTPLMISMYNPEGRVLMRNPAATALINSLGISDAAVADAYLGMFVDPGAAQRLRVKALSRGKAEATLALVGRPGRIHHVSLRRVHDPLSGSSALLAAQQDVTKAQRLERRLQRGLERERKITEAQRHFLSIASHEFKSPLAIVDGAAQRILRATRAPDPALVERIGAIRAAVRRIGQAIDNTLAMIRIDDRKVACIVQPTDLAMIVERVRATLFALDPDREIRLDLANLPRVSIDPLLTAHVLENILSNAIKYSPSGTPIDIAAKVVGRHVVLTVADKGIGIPAADLGRMFTRFARGANVGAVPGTGVGLSAVRSFMHLQGGAVRLESREGAGTRVELTFRR